MKKILAIFLLIQIASNNLFAEEMTRIPGLIKHYYHHKEEHGDVTGFLNFLHKHYSASHSSTGHQHGEHEDDCNLPFKHCGDDPLNLHQPLNGALPEEEKLHSAQPPCIEYMIEDENIRSLHLCNIWQPPKLI